MIPKDAPIEHAPKPSAPKFQQRRFGNIFTKNVGHMTVPDEYWDSQPDPANPYEADAYGAE
eukprot:7764380-Karenia_brevis.AAC.1